MRQRTRVSLEEIGSQRVVQFPVRCAILIPRTEQGMDADFLDEKTCDLTRGSRKAVALFRRYERGWMIDTISEVGYPDTGDSDSYYPTLEMALTEANRMWQ